MQTIEWWVQINVIYAENKRSVDQIKVDKYGEFVSSIEKGFKAREKCMMISYPIVLFLASAAAIFLNIYKTNNRFLEVFVLI